MKKVNTVAVLAGLRQKLATLEHGVSGSGQCSAVPFGIGEIDAALPWGGLASGMVHEVVGGDGGHAALGFCSALLARFAQDRGMRRSNVLWCRGRNDLYAPGLLSFGLDQDRLLLAEVSKDRDILWAMEEGLRSGALTAVLGEPSTLTTTALRRLQLAAETGGTAAFLLRPRGSANVPGPIATRWQVSALPSLGRDFYGARPLGQPRWQLELVRCRNGSVGRWSVEWRDGRRKGTTDETARGFALAPDLRDGPDQTAATQDKNTDADSSARMAG